MTPRLAACLVALTLASVTVAQDAAQPPAPQAPPAAAPAHPPFDPEAPAETQFKNIKVLTGMPAGQLRDTMEFIEGALGMGCGACHVRGGMEKDDKPAKETARKMIRMVQALNRDTFEGKPVVTCFTCHQGRPKPESVPVFTVPQPAGDAFVKDVPPPPQRPRPGQPPPPPAAEPALPAAGAVVDRFIAAIGGQAALASMTALRLHATQPDQERSASIDMTWQPPASMSQSIRIGEGDQVLEILAGTDGAQAWMRRGMEPGGELRGSRHMSALRDAELLPAFVFAPERPPMETLATGRIGETAVVAVGVQARDGATDRFYFDAGTGLLVRRAFDAPTALGDIPHAIDYDEWRAEGGVKLPHAVTSRQPGEASTMTIDQVRPAGAIDPSIFAKPAP